MLQGIRGKRIKLYTGFSIGRNSYIYDESVPGDAISLNGYHEAIVIIIDDQEIVFDNHHPEGITKNEWMSNLLFDGLLYQGQQFQITEDDF
jgi:hypothetical protein